MKSQGLLSKRFLFTTILICLSTVVALGLSEAILQLLLPSSTSNGYYIWSPHLKATFKPHEDVMPGISGESTFSVNSQGFRGDEMEPRNTYRILAIGGSTTECLYLDQSEMWTQLLQERINKNTNDHRIWIGNAGVSGRTTRHHLIALEKLPLSELKTDAVILLVGVNDFSTRLSHDKSYDPDYLNNPTTVAKLEAETFTASPQEGAFYKQTAIWQLLRMAKKLVLPNKHQDNAGKIYITWRQHRQNAKDLRSELPDLASALEEYARNINKIIDLSNAKSVRLILMTQPTMWGPGLSNNLKSLLWLGGIGDFQKEAGKSYYTTTALQKGINAYNDTLLRVCRERSIECIDLASIFRNDTTIFYDDVHYNELGAQKLAQAVSEHILMRPPFMSGALNNQVRIMAPRMTMGGLPAARR